MKKLLFIALSGMMLLAFTQCGGGKGSKEFQDGLNIYEQAEKSIKAASTCEELEKAVTDMFEKALATEQKYAEGEKATEEEEAELNQFGDKLRELYKEKSEKLGCGK